MSDRRDRGAMSDVEIDEMVRLLTLYFNTELDQWERWRIESAHGPVYVDIGREPDPSVDVNAYVPIGRRPSGGIGV